MLTVTRKAGQGVVIGKGIRITVKEVRGRNVRLVIDAPREIPVYREELYEAIARENERAARPAAGGLDQLD